MNKICLNKYQNYNNMKKIYIENDSRTYHWKYSILFV